MKKISALILSLSLVFSLASCSQGEDHNHDHDHSGETTVASSHGHSHGVAPVTTADSLSTGMTEEFSADEDAAYHELFYDKNTEKYENKEFTKKGTFAILRDAYAGHDRYYVWGYGDEKKDCCYQWEFVMPEGADVPERGSYIEIKGTMKHSDNALDKYWLENVEIVSVTPFEKTDYDIDFTTMSPTLIRVQMINMFQKAESFVHNSIRVIGKTTSENTLSDLQGEGSWSVHFAAAEKALEAEKTVLMEGIFNESGADTMLYPTSIVVEK